MKINSWIDKFDLQITKTSMWASIISLPLGIIFFAISFCNQFINSTIGLIILLSGILSGLVFAIIMFNEIRNLNSELRSISSLRKYNNARMLDFLSINIHPLLRKVINAISVIYEEYCKYNERIEKIEEKKEPSIYSANEIRDIYFDKIKHVIHEFCEDIVSNTKLTVEQYLKDRGIDEKISVCIKLFDKPINKGDKWSENLVYNFFRDKESYEKRRHCSNSFYKLDISPYHQCMTSDEKSFVCNDIMSQIKEGSKYPENATKYYNAIAASVIYNANNNIKYGIIALDSENKQKANDLFIKEDIRIILATYADLFAIFYAYLEPYSSDIDLFTSLWKSKSEEARDVC